METAGRIRRAKWWRVRHRLLRQEHIVIVLTLVRITKTADDRQVWQRDPKVVGVKDVIADLCYAGEIEKGVIALPELRHRLAKRGIEMRSENSRAGKIVFQSRVGVTGGEPEVIGEPSLSDRVSAK